MRERHFLGAHCITLLTSLWLTGCASQNMQSNTPLPPPDNAGTSTSPIMTQSALLEELPVDEKLALTHFLKTQKATVIENDQHIQFPFGRIISTIYCSPLHACDIALQWGEQVTGVYPGDTARWLFEEALSDGAITHIIFKPKALDITTNVIITTNRRTYHLNLASRNEKGDTAIKSISFYYPDDFLRHWQDIQKEEKETAVSSNQSEFHDLDFHYKIDKPFFKDNPPWVPVRVFNNGKQVYIQMPDTSNTLSLPVLFVVGNDQELVLVNYRIRKPYYIVDQLFQKAILANGVGDYQQRITIIYDTRGAA